jgi:hypothetical protein
MKRTLECAGVKNRIRSCVRIGKLKHFLYYSKRPSEVCAGPLEYESHEPPNKLAPSATKGDKARCTHAPLRFRVFLLGSGRRTPRAPQSWLPTASLRYPPLRSTCRERLPRHGCRLDARTGVRARVGVLPDFVRASARARATAGRSDPAHAAVRHHARGSCAPCGRHGRGGN